VSAGESTARRSRKTEGAMERIFFLLRLNLMKLFWRRRESNPRPKTFNR
jgi:hypothetical protein